MRVQGLTPIKNCDQGSGAAEERERHRRLNCNNLHIMKRNNFSAAAATASDVCYSGRYSSYAQTAIATSIAGMIVHQCVQAPFWNSLMAKMMIMVVMAAAVMLMIVRGCVMVKTRMAMDGDDSCGMHLCHRCHISMPRETHSEIALTMLDEHKLDIGQRAEQLNTVA